MHSLREEAPLQRSVACARRGRFLGSSFPRRREVLSNRGAGHPVLSLARHSSGSWNGSFVHDRVARILRGFRPPSCGRVTFLYFAKRKVTERNAPRSAPCGRTALRVRERAPGFFDSTSVCWRKTRAHRARDRCATFPPPTRRGSGAPGRSGAHSMCAEAEAEPERAFALVLLSLVIPAQAGGALQQRSWSSSSCSSGRAKSDSSVRWNDDQGTSQNWMTSSLLKGVSSQRWSDDPTRGFQPALE